MPTAGILAPGRNAMDAAVPRQKIGSIETQSAGGARICFPTVVRIQVPSQRSLGAVLLLTETAQEGCSLGGGRWFIHYRIAGGRRSPGVRYDKEEVF